MRRQTRRFGVLTGIAALVLALPAAALAGEKTATDDTTTDDTAVKDDSGGLELGDVTSTLPLLGSGLTVSVTVGDDGISEVTLDPAAGDPTKQSDHVAIFELDDGETKVFVMAGKHGVRTSVRSDSIDDVSGPGTWSADVFGTGAVSVPYTVGVGADGAPTIDVGTVAAPGDVTVEVRDPEAKSFEGDHKTWAGAKVSIVLTSGDQTAVITISVSSYEKADGTTAAAVSVTVSDGERHKGFRGCGGRDHRRRGGWDDGHRGDRGDHGTWGRSGHDGTRGRTGWSRSK